jgi:hypothetical protein
MTNTLPAKNIYRFDFASTDWAKGHGHNDSIVCAPVLPSEFNAALLDAEGNPIDGTLFMGQTDDAPAALIYRVVALTADAFEKTGLKAGDFALVRNMSGHSTSARVKFFLFQPNDLLWSWSPGEL